jgi:hypothetical protein
MVLFQDDVAAACNVAAVLCAGAACAAECGACAAGGAEWHVGWVWQCKTLSLATRQCMQIRRVVAVVTGC